MKFIKKHIKLIIVIIVILLGGIILLKAISGNKEEMEETEFGFVSVGDISKYIENSGVIKSDNGEVVGTVAGKIIKDNVKEGNMVNKGELLYTIDTSSIQEEMADVSQEIKVLQEEYDNLKKELGSKNVIVDINGIVESIDVSVGDEIRKGDTVAKVLNTDKMMVTVQLDEEKEYLINDLYVRKSIKLIVNNKETDGVISQVSGNEFSVLFNRVGNEKEGDKAKTSLTGDKEYLITYYDEVSITSLVSGKVASIGFTNNSTISKGSILLSTSNSSSSELTAKEKELSNKKRELNKLSKSIDDASVYAPIKGIITSKKVKVNDSYDGNSTMCVISGNQEYYTTMEVSEDEIKNIEEGMKVKIKSKLLDKELEGEISKISYNPTGQDEMYVYDSDNSLSYYPVTITIKDTNEQEIFNGMHVSLKIVLFEKKNILVVPSDAILEGEYVYKVTKEKPLEYEKVYVKVGVSDNENVEVINGLEEDDEVILYSYNGEEYYDE